MRLLSSWVPLNLLFPCRLNLLSSWVLLNMLSSYWLNLISSWVLLNMLSTWVNLLRWRHRCFRIQNK